MEVGVLRGAHERAPRLKFPFCRRTDIHSELRTVAHVGAAHPEDDVFCDVSRVISYSLQLPGNEEDIQVLLSLSGVLLHTLDQNDEGLVLHTVNDVVHLKNGFRHVGMRREERLKGTANHGRDGRGHAADVDWYVQRSYFEQVKSALGDVDGLIANSFEVSVDLQHGNDKAEIDRHGLLHCEKVEREFVDAALKAVDVLFARKHLFAEAGVPAQVCAGGHLHGAFGHAAHLEEFLFQFVKALLKFRSHPNLPVT